MLYVSFFTFPGLVVLVTREVRPRASPSSYGHTTVKAPHPIRTAKLSIVGPVQYFGRGLQGNHGCCMSFFIFFSNFFILQRFLLSRTGFALRRIRPGVASVAIPLCPGAAAAGRICYIHEAEERTKKEILNSELNSDF